METPPPLPPSSAIPPSQASPPPLPEFRASTTVTKTRRPFLKAFACGVVLFAAIVPFIVLSGTDNLTYRCTYVCTRCFLAALPTAIWCYMDKQPWPWWRLMVTVLGFYVALVVIQMRGSHHT